MEPRHRISPRGVALIKRFEGLRRSAARLPGGGWTVGYGHTRSAREGAQVDERDAEALLRYDLQPVEAAVNASVYTPLTQNQFDALTAFAFSAGADAFRRSNVLRRVNEGDLLAAAAALETWRRAEFEGESIVVDALVRRRAAEKALFLTPADGFIPAPSTALRPQLDYAAPGARHAGEAAEIVTPLDGDAVVPERATASPGAGALDAPSPAQAAAAAVSRRLEALFAHDPETGRPETTRSDSTRSEQQPPELLADPALAPFPPQGVDDAPRGLVEVLTQPETGDLTTQSAGEEAFDRRIAYTEPTVAPRERESLSPYILLGIIGVALFIVGVIVILQGRAVDAVGPGNSTFVGGVMGVIGIGAFCTAMYEILKSQGPRADG